MTAFNLLKKTINEFMDDDCPSMAAALAYYTAFSLPGLLLIVLRVAGTVFGEQAVSGSLDEQISGLIGPQAARQVQTMIQSVATSEAGGLAAWFGVLTLIFGATTAFAQLQNSLNRAWEVMPDPNTAGWKNFITKRLLSFGLILGIAFLLMVSLVVSALVGAFGDMLERWLPSVLTGGLLLAINYTITLAVLTALFAAIYRMMPDAVVSWRDVGVGAFATAVLFVIGKFAVGMYLGNSDVGSAFGAAGSLAIILVWIYYSSNIILLGAEFTQVWAQEHGHGIEPEPGAVHIVKRVEMEPEPAR
jgi:membrane protein